MKFTVLSMVKNEADIIESFVRHNLQFADELFVLDNGSDDNTFLILQKLQEEGLPLHLSQDSTLGYQQQQLSARLLTSAQMQSDADVFMLLDADEFICIHPDAAVYGQMEKYREFFHTHLKQLKQQGVVALRWLNFLPIDKGQSCDYINHFQEFSECTQPPLIHQKAIYSRDILKNAHTVAGNHFLIKKQTGEMIEQTFLQHIAIAHFPIRSKEQAIAKILTGAIALSSRSLGDGESFHVFQMRREIVSKNYQISMEKCREIAKSYGVPSFYTGGVSLRKGQLNPNTIEHKYLHLNNANLVRSLDRVAMLFAQNSQVLRVQFETIQQELSSTQQELSSMQQKLWSVRQHIEKLQGSHHKYKKLWILRLFKPLIKTEQAISSANRYRKGFQRLVKEQGSVGKAYQACRRLFKETSSFKVVKRFLIESKHRELTLSERGDIENPKNGVVILATRHTSYIAQLISYSLKKINIDTEIIFDKPVSGYANKWHFVVCPQMFESLPSAYFAFQMEQSVSSRWFTQEYFDRLRKAEFVFDYSLTNIAFLQDHGMPFKKLYYLPVDVLPTLENTEIMGCGDFEYDVAFYGDVKSERRQIFLSKLREKFSVLVISEVFGEDLYTQLKKAKVIVNVHYYENALLETTRIYECLSLNKAIVSEVGSDQFEHGDIEHVVDFVGIDDVDAMVAKVERLLNDQSYFQSRVDAIRQLKDRPNKFEFYFNRFLLSQDLLDFDEFYKLCSDYIKPQNDFWCLSLAETTDRRKDFDKDNVHDIWVFPGLRHNIGWVGCGLSYKLMMRMAKDLDLPQVTICEDDVLLDERFERRYSHVKQALTKADEPWDVFSGLIADLSKETEIFNSAIQSDNEAFYAINRLVSMVFNIYNKTSYQKIIDWDDKIHMPSNTIDRYIEQHDGIKGLIVSPFLVGHKEDATSTLWGFQNTQYKDMIEKSQALLNEMIRDLSQEVSN